MKNNIELQRRFLPAAQKTLVAIALVVTVAYAVNAQDTNTFPGSGNAGIGTTSPSASLEINKSQNAQTNLYVLNGTNNSASAALVLFGEQASDGHYSYFGHFSRGYNPGGATFAEPGSFAMFGGSDGNVNIATNNNKKFQVWTTPDNGANWAVRFAVDPVGNVGIGTTSPNQKLSVAGMGAFYNSTPVTPSGVRGLFMGNFSVGSSIWSYDYTSGQGDALLLTGQGIHLNTYVSGNSTNRLYIANDGNVGIGNTSPAYKLDVAGAINATALNVNGSPVSGTQWSTSGSNISYSTGNVGIGTSASGYKLDVNGNTNVTGNLNVTGNINAKYQDVAEWVPSSEQLSAGTVVVLDTTKSNQVIASASAYDTRVAGVISAQPGITLGEGGEGKVLVATTGRVRVKVDTSRGPIQIGDLLVTSDVLGVAMKSEAIEFAGRKMHMPGTIIGKALEPLAKGSGEILVLLSLQ